MRRRMIIALLAALATQPALAKLYKCMDAKGNVYYTDKLTAECLKEGSEELSKRGVVIKQNTPALTPEQRKAKEETLLKSREEERTEQERRRRDRALLATYANEQEIDLARDRNLQQSQAVVQSLKSQLKTVQDRLKELQAKVQGYSAQKKPVPDYLKEEVAAAGKDVKQFQGQIAQKEQEIEQIKARFEADKKRFRELTQSNR